MEAISKYIIIKLNQCTFLHAFRFMAKMKMSLKTKGQANYLHLLLNNY